jgi:hypothetical protein
MRSTNIALLLAILAGGCGGGTSPTQAPKSPAPVSTVSSVVPTCATPLASGASEPCSVVVTGNGTFNKIVNWSSSGGTISSAGMLTAPSVTSITSIVVTATTVQDSVIGIAMVSVTPPTTPPPPGVGTLTLSATILSFSNVVIGTASPTQSAILSNTGNGIVHIVNFAISGTGFALAAANSCATGELAVNSSCTIAVVFTPTETAAKQGLVSIQSSNSTNSLAEISLSGTGANPPAPPRPSGPENLGLGIHPLMRVDSNGAIDVAWLTQAGVNFRRSTDGGATFSDAVLAIPQPVFADDLQMQIDSSNAIVIFSSYQGVDDPEPIPQIARSIDGKTFTLQSVPSRGLLPALAVEPSGAINVAWFGFDNNTLYEIRSTDGGVTYSNPKILWSTPDDALEVVAAVGPQGQIYLFWGHEAGSCDIFFSASLDGAQTFSTPKQISDSGGCDVSPVPHVDAAGNVNVAWQTNATDISFTRSTDQGQTFTKVTQAATGIDVNSPEFVVGPDSETDLVYDSAVIGGAAFQVFFTQSIDHGASFSTSQNLSLPHPVVNFTGAGDASVAVDSDGRITVVFEDDSKGTFSGDFDIYERTSTDSVTFSDATDLSKTTDQTEVFPQIVVTQTGLRYFVWSDTSDTQASNPVVSAFFDAVP